MPVWKQKKRPFTRPSPIGRRSPASIPPASSSTAATGSLGRPIVRANTFVDPPGQHAEGGVGAGDPGRHLVERAVAAEADDDVDVAPGGVGGEAGGVAAAVRLDELDLVVAGEAALHDDGVARRHRRRERVDDEQDPQAAAQVMVAERPATLWRRYSSVTMAGHEHHRLRQADPRSGRARASSIPTTTR